MLPPIPSPSLRSLASRRWCFAVAALVPLLVGQQPTGARADAAAQAALEARLRADVTHLASTELSGRGSGTPGGDAAARWIADRYQSLGLVPAGADGTYFQDFDLPPARRFSGLPIEKAIPIAVVARGQRTTLMGLDSTNLEFTLASSPGRAEGVIVDVGDGDKYDKDTWDSPLPKIALARLRKEPEAKPASQPSAAGPAASSPAAPSGHGDLKLPPSLRSFAFQARQHKAAGLIVVVASKSEIPRYSGEDRSLELPILFATASAETILLRCDAFEFDAGVTSYARRTRNVLALVPAAHPDAEILVIGAHYDHLGLGGADSLAPGQVAIHPGADDNASGTATILELARRYATKKGTLPRALLFASWGGEEMGLLGSKRWVKEPTVAWDRVVANVNFDMVGRSKDRSLNIGGIASAKGWKEMVEEANQSLQKPLAMRASAKLTGIGGSDHMSFQDASRPALFFFTGLHPDYHKPTDTADKIEYGTMGEVAGLAEAIIDRLERAPKIEFVKPPDPPPSSGPASAGAERGLRTWLGTIPDYGADDGGVVLSGVSSGSPAEKAGMKAKDVLTKVGAYEIKDINDLTEALARLRPGEEVDVVFLRDGAKQTIRLTLGARR